MEVTETHVIRQLIEKAASIRHQLINMTYHSRYAHLGGPLSLCDMAVALYYRYLNFDPKDPKNPERDRLVLSKGHSADLFYNIFVDLGMYDQKELYTTYNKYLSNFGQHPNRMYNVGFEVSTGSLGHGLSIACGMAVAARADKAKYRIVCITGDGELQEGSNWEALMFAGHNQFGNLVLVVDRNGVQGNGFTEETVRLEPLPDKLAAFGWDVRVLEDGNDMQAICQLWDSIPAADPTLRRKPIAIVSYSQKGCGIDFMEKDGARWHAGGIGDDLLQVCHDSIERHLAASLAKL
jgi:transketolase